jgi:hypothetical protein
MRAVRDPGTDDIEIFPVVVVMQTFRARPSAVPAIREFVRQHLAQTSLSGDDVRSLGQRVADVLLDTAGTGGAIQVSLRIFGGHAEVDVLQTHDGEATGSTGALTTAPPADGPPGRTQQVAGANGTNGHGTNGHAPNGQPANGHAAAGLAPAVMPTFGGPSGSGGEPRPAGGGIQRFGTFAEWLAEALRREGMTMEAAARQLRVSVKTVSRWVGGATEPRLRDLSRIREVFGELPFP